MKLIIERDQRDKTSILGKHKGVTFSLSCKVELTSEEKKLVERYQASGHVLTYKSASDGARLPGQTVGGLMAGVYQEMDDVGTLLNNEEVIKSACQDFKNLLEVMKTFGGQEVTEF